MAKWQIKQKLDNPMTVKKLKEAFALDCSISEACYYAEISRQSYYDLIEYKPALLDEFNRLREKPVLLARQVLIQGIVWSKNKDWKQLTPPNAELALKYLERKRKAEFSTRVEQTWVDGEAIEVKITSLKQRLSDKWIL